MSVPASLKGRHFARIDPFRLFEESMRKTSTLQLFVLSLVCLLPIAAAQTSGKPPVIIIPGITGSQLVNRNTGKTVWFSVKRDKDDDLRLPMTSPILSRNRDPLEVKDIIREIELPVLPDVEVYKSLIEALKGRGYTEATWDAPKTADVFYVFPYDWRRDNVETAGQLIRAMSDAKRKLRQPNLKFDIIAHSMGGLVARYAAMYGAADLPRDGALATPTWSGAQHIRKLMMFGTPNQGSFASFEAIIDGYPLIADRKLPFIDDLRSEDVLSNPSVFQLIPHQPAARFLDENLQPKDVDIYDLETWLEYGWGALTDPKFLSKLKDAHTLARENKDIKPEAPGKDANADDRILATTTYLQVRAYLGAALRRAKGFHMALDASAKTIPIEIYAYGGNCAPTLDAVILMRDEKKDRWTTLFKARDIKTSDGKEIKKDQVQAAMFTPGDGRVTKSSLLAEAQAAKTAAKTFVTSSFLACGTHFKLFLEKPIQDSFLSALVVEKKEQP